jgi:hypothetical protein
MKNLEGADSNEVDEYQYEEKAEEFLRLKKTQQLDSSNQEERKTDSKNQSLSFDKEINTKYSRRDNNSP